MSGSALKFSMVCISHFNCRILAAHRSSLWNIYLTSVAASASFIIIKISGQLALTLQLVIFDAAILLGQAVSNLVAGLKPRVIEISNGAKSYLTLLRYFRAGVCF